MKEDIYKGAYDIFSFILQNSNEYILVLNENSQIEYINEDNYLQGLGYSKKDIIGKKITYIIHPEDQKLIFDKNFKIIESNNKKDLELHVKDKHGNWKLFEVKIKVFPTYKNGMKRISWISPRMSKKRSASILFPKCWMS